MSKLYLNILYTYYNTTTIYDLIHHKGITGYYRWNERQIEFTVTMSASIFVHYNGVHVCSMML